MRQEWKQVHKGKLIHTWKSLEIAETKGTDHRKYDYILKEYWLQRGGQDKRTNGQTQKND